jgi:hypothetical protein
LLRQLATTIKIKRSQKVGKSCQKSCQKRGQKETIDRHNCVIVLAPLYTKKNTFLLGFWGKKQENAVF